MHENLYGVYTPEDELTAVHKTEEGANKNKDLYESQHGEGFYVDVVVLHD